MESESSARPFVSIVTTVRNEEAHLRPLLESLIPQEPPFEIVLVDGGSYDSTFALAEEYGRRYPGQIRPFRRATSRGEGRNVGVAAAKGELIAFIDGDCVADPGWLGALRDGFSESPVVAGKTVPIVVSKFGELERVELYVAGSDVTYPSSNLGYRRSLFQKLGGFDPRFVTAEDIDLNLRAVRAGVTIRYVPEAVVFHRPRATWPTFVRQAFWNGYGRKQLTEKHGSLWERYRIERLATDQHGYVALVRLGAAMTGYLARVLTGGHERLGTPSSRSAAGLGSDRI